jgi:hypothetical protein
LVGERAKALKEGGVVSAIGATSSPGPAIAGGTRRLERVAMNTRVNITRTGYILWSVLGIQPPPTATMATLDT